MNFFRWIYQIFRPVDFSFRDEVTPVDHNLSVNFEAKRDDAKAEKEIEVPQILAVRGLSETSSAFRSALWDMAKRNGWNVDPIATVMSLESRFKPSAKNPYATATGLIQFIESTAKRLGTTTAALKNMTAVEQLPFVEKYYKLTGANAAWRPVDYYLAGWGSGIGEPYDHVLATRGSHVYDINAGLDADGNGTITVGDLAKKVSDGMMAAKGKFIPIERSAAVGIGAALAAGAAYLGVKKYKKG